MYSQLLTNGEGLSRNKVKINLTLEKNILTSLRWVNYYRQITLCAIIGSHFHPPLLDAFTTNPIAVNNILELNWDNALMRLDVASIYTCILIIAKIWCLHFNQDFVLSMAALLVINPKKRDLTVCLTFYKRNWLFSFNLYFLWVALLKICILYFCIILYYTQLY